MTATKAPSAYVSGLCHSGLHDRCRGDFKTAVCTCPHHTAPPPEVLGQADAALTEVAVAALERPRHCPSCTCTS